MRGINGPRTVRWACGVLLALIGGFVVVPPVPVAQAQPAESVPEAFHGLSVGPLHSCAILVDGRLKCWGDNFRGQLGLGDTTYRGDTPNDMGSALPAVPLGPGRSATAVAVGHQHTCALLDNGSVKCWGANFDGQLGQGPLSPTVVGDNPGEMGGALPAVDLGDGATATAISVGVNTSCALLTGGDVKCWGNNDKGQLGQGDTVDRGSASGTMGDALLPVDLGDGRTATAISAASQHTCAVLDTGDVKCWGNNDVGQLGIPVLNPADSNVGNESGEMGDDLPTVELGSGRTATAVSVSGYVGQSYSCALLDDASVKCWGHNADGQLGQEDDVARGHQPEDMGDGLAPVDLGTGRTAVAVVTGWNHACALIDDDTLKCWGWNIAGQLGQGDDDDRGDAAEEMGDELLAIDLGTGRTVAAVAAGNSHTCAVLDDESIRCWGQNYYGELGIGVNDQESVGDDPGEMGDALPAVDLGDGAPNPPTFCDGQQVTVELALGDLATGGPDVIRGTPGADTVSGLGGADIICGLGGNDILSGGAGPDRLFGEAGGDTLRGGADVDLVDGGADLDRLFGDTQVDTLKGGVGNDVIYGGTENDSVFGGTGNDRVFGQGGRDTLRGEAGADVLDGGDQNDRLLGGPSRDTCHGRSGTDSQTGCEVRTGIP